MVSLTGRMLLSMTALIGLLIGVGYAAVVLLGAPVWFPVAFAIVMVLLQYAVGPWVIRHLIPADVIEHANGRYLTDAPIGELVSRRCRDAGVPLVRLGIIDDGSPNAFAFGRTPWSAHVWVSRGLIERLDDDELDAVIAHELGHVRHWDMAVMTVAAVVPMALYMLYVVARGFNRPEARAVALGAFVAYLVSELGVLAVSRVRELAADRWSCACTHNGDALASALVKIAYGIGEADAQRRRSEEKVGFREARMDSMRVLGIMSSRDGEAMTALLASETDARAAISGLTWDRTSPWARVLEKLSTHPLVATRIDMLARSGLDGAPVGWAAAGKTMMSDTELAKARRRFGPQAAVAVAPWAVLVPALAALWGLHNATWLGWALLAGGALLFVKQRLRYPFGHRPTEQVTSLLERLDAGPVAGVPVEVRGRIMGRETPGYALSPDLVLADDSGFVPLVYRNPLPFADTWFAVFRANDFLGREVVARGWYFRGPGPWVELRDVATIDPPELPPGPEKRPRARGWQWVARHVFAVAVFCVGVGVVLAGAGA